MTKCHKKITMCGGACDQVRSENPARLSRCALVMFLALAADSLWANMCTINTQGVAFGAYDVFSQQALDGAGNIGVNCDVSTTYSISLSPGGGTYAGRTMANGANKLAYNLYSDATRTVVWGDGTSGTVSAGATATSGNSSIYGRIPALQNRPVGSYYDSITVTLSF